MSTHPVRRTPSTSSRTSDRLGLTRSHGPDTVYDLDVVVTDVIDVVRCAGGWIYDRARAGWKVTALMAPGLDGSPLRVLGARTADLDIEATHVPAAVACSAEILDEQHPLRSRMIREMGRRTVEVTVWGRGALETDRRLGEVQHELSQSARAFKRAALKLAKLDEPPSSHEAFRSCNTWYPLEGGADLIHLTQ